MMSRGGNGERKHKNIVDKMTEKERAKETKKNSFHYEAFFY